ncbi:MAG: primase C-terminal domain-containing protein [Spirochaetaceae bacterium]|nr:primase C-terminal domain-containing protein [Spirochaetaceae bacterium]
MELRKWKPASRDVSGLGRNCAVFDKTRFFAYAEWKRQGFEDAGILYDAVFSHAMNINSGFHIPMLDKEVHCIAKSITKWTSRHMMAEGLKGWRRKQNRKSVKVRRKKAAERTAEIKAYSAKRKHVTASRCAG